jgi:hypothetical protein
LGIQVVWLLILIITCNKYSGCYNVFHRRKELRERRREGVFMKRNISLVGVLAAMLFTALPALAGSGPYGNLGPSLDGDWRGVETEHVAMIEGTGPFGLFGPAEYNIIPGAEKQTLSIAWGNGPYGIFTSDGLVARDKANRHECLLVAVNCPVR